MSHAPADRVRRANMKGAAVSCAKHGEGFYLIAFDWQPLFSTFNLEEADLMVGDLADRCFRAIVRVKKNAKGFSTSIVEVGGEDRVYGFDVNFTTKNLGHWRAPAEAQALEVLFLRRV